MLNEDVDGVLVVDAGITRDELACPASDLAAQVARLSS
jgi:hypothetical protein